MPALISAAKRIDVAFPTRTFADEPSLAIRMPQDGYARHDPPRVLINHKINGDQAERVVPGAMPADANLAWRNDHCWQNDGRAGATQAVNDGTVLQTGDLVTCAAYGAGWANGDAVQIEHCEQKDGTTWSKVIDVGAAFNDAVARALGIARQFVVRKLGDHTPGFREAWPNFSGATSHYTVDYENRGYWDCGRAVFDELHANFGWTEVALADVIHGAPPVPLPSWLDPARELAIGTYRGSHADFALAAVESALAWYRAAGLPIGRAFELAANAVAETGWGRVYAGHNLGGWKIHQDDVDAYAAKAGSGPAWWKRQGHASSGDPPWCFYRAFDDDAAFMKEFLVTFTPRPTEPDPHGRYRETGRAFWQGGDWFDALVKAGYKGTPPDPAGTIASLHSLARTAQNMWVQSKVGADVDGIWGPQSQAALVRATGASAVDDAVLAKLAK